MGPDDQAVDTEQLLEQGDELLRASRRLLEDLDEVIDVDPPVATDQTGSSADSR